MRRNWASQDWESRTCLWVGQGSRTDRPKDRQARVATYTTGSRTRVSTAKNILPPWESPGQMAGSSRHGQPRPFACAGECTPASIPLVFLFPEGSGVTNEALEKTVKSLVKLMTGEKISHSGRREKSVNTQGIEPAKRLSGNQQAFIGHRLLFTRFCAQLCVWDRDPIKYSSYSWLSCSQRTISLFQAPGDLMTLHHSFIHSKHFIEGYCARHCVGLMLWQANRVLALVELKVLLRKASILAHPTGNIVLALVVPRTLSSHWNSSGRSPRWEIWQMADGKSSLLLSNYPTQKTIPPVVTIKCFLLLDVGPSLCS